MPKPQPSLKDLPTETISLLLVDDHPENLLALEAILSGAGKYLVKAGSGRQALRCLLERDFAVILMDVQMPEMDGFETAALIRERERNRATPIIFLTATSNSELEVIKGYTTGAVDYIIKPFVPEILRAKVASFVELQRMAQQVASQAQQLAALNQTLAAQLLEVSRLNQDLQLVNEELESFSYSASHDLRAPLRQILALSKIVLEKNQAALDRESQDCLRMAVSSAEHMGQLIEDLLQLSRITRVAVSLQPVDLSALAQDIAARLAAGQPERQVEWKLAEGVTAQGDPHLLRILLENLLGNAWKYTGKREKAMIEFGLRGPDLPAPPRPEGPNPPSKIYFVHDDGIGFNMKHAQGLFKPFQRLHGQSEFPGTGIGLSIVHRILRRHGGRIWAEGEEDRGATFYFTLD
jgi:two-component system, sensor histidine kinase and response regulator